MFNQGNQSYDVFVSYNDADEAWVLNWLVPRLKKAMFRVATKDEIRIIGAPTIRNIERGIDNSYRTIVVLSPAWVADDSNEFESLLVMDQDRAARQRKLLPVLLQPSDLPRALAMREAADFTKEARWEQALKSLTRSISDVIPIPAPWQPLSGPNRLAQWKRWLYRYRRRLVGGTLALLLGWVALFTWLGIWPFQPRSVWLMEVSTPPQTTLLYNTGQSLMTGSNNIEPGCRHAYKGLRYRLLKPDSQWQDSQVSDELLCIENWQGSGQDALSNIVAFASPPDQPQVVYALTSHSGLLVSDDSGASFKRSPISDQLPDLVIDHRISSPLVISHQTQPDFWIISNNQGLLRFSAGEWRRMAGQGAASCENLPDVDISSLLVTADIIVIGTESHGLWASYDDGQTCRPVFDAGPNSRYDFYGLWNVRTGQPRFLALVRDWNVELDDQQGTWQLLDLCPRPDSCSPTTWQAETNPIWHNGAALWGNPPVSHVLVQQREQTYEWYLVTEAGQVWQGDLEGGELTDLPDIRRCYNPAVVCNLSLAPSEEGATPYLLAANRIYHFEEGPWWHLWWP